MAQGRGSLLRGGCKSSLAVHFVPKILGLSPKTQLDVRKTYDVRFLLLHCSSVELLQDTSQGLSDYRTALLDIISSLNAHAKPS